MTASRAQTVVTFETAMKLIERATAHASDNDWRVAVVVTDPNGLMIASGRMDGVPAPVHEFAADKAYTAILGRPTTGYYERMSSNDLLRLGASNRPRLCAWEGGLPILEDGVLIGGLGVSGAAGPDDIACGTSALTALGLTAE